MFVWSDAIIGEAEITDEFHVDSETSANWVLRKMGNLAAERRRVQAQATEIINQILGEEKRLRERFEGELAHYAQMRLADGKRKTLHLLYGTLAFRRVPAHLTITDMEAAQRAAEHLGPAYWKTYLDTAEYRACAQERLSADGELMPGVTQVPARESFSIRFGKEEE